MLFQVWSPCVPVRLNPRVCSLAFKPLNVLTLFLYLPSSTLDHILLILQKCPPCPFSISAGRRVSPLLQLFMNTSSNNMYLKKGLHKVYSTFLRSTHITIPRSNAGCSPHFNEAIWVNSYTDMCY